MIDMIMIRIIKIIEGNIKKVLIVMILITKIQTIKNLRKMIIKRIGIKESNEKAKVLK